MEAEFLVSAARPEQFPAENLPEVAFLGRSNVGKSSLLNALVGRPGLAFTSATPGRTQGINFYRVDGRYHFVDLPGYGYAKVPEAIRRSWKQLIEQYLGGRKTLELSILLIDSRRGWMEHDQELGQWLELHGRRFLVIATKTDKLKSRSDHDKGMAAIRAGGFEVLPFSARTGRGVREIWQAITRIRNSPPQ
ncbi:MAG TPA: ribosome biogenesis GTP-binding protein YihA/YsxC [Bryobacteraceae bacterium]|nr:ribosome biogenesis GTP-binding protein YihA/YsxC [Bryobacteraceae bacterium]